MNAAAPPRHGLWILAFFCLLGLCIGCAVYRPADYVGLTIQPTRLDETPPVRYVGGPRLDHVAHADRGLDCTDCHEMDETTGEPGMPTLESCMECHEDVDEEKPESEHVSKLFFDADGKQLWQRGLVAYDAEVKFGHRPHAKVGECDACHGDMASDPRGRLARPMYTMDDCMRCHQQQQVENGCSTCHERLDVNVAPPSHDRMWQVRHGRAALVRNHADVASRCSMCHDEPEDCDACHQTQLPSTHGPGWRRGHGDVVRAAGGSAQASCTYCHKFQSFCDSCHQREAPRDHHHLWKQRHGQVVRAAGGGLPASCATCHRSRTFCDRCHFDEPPRNHTTLFRTRTHGVLASIDRASCATCHHVDFCVRCHQDTPPRSHRAGFAMGRNTHCVQCHFPISTTQGCRACHFGNPTHSTAPPQPPGHVPGRNCRVCHNAIGGGGARPLRHLDNGQNCETCHR